MKHNSLEVQFLLDALDYDPETGIFRWKRNVGSRGKTGQETAKGQNRGYKMIRLKGTNFLAHRLAFVLMTGKWPEGEVDHINMDRSDNRWMNLRVAAHGQNQANGNKYKSNKSGFKGVSWIASKRKWVAAITVNKKTRYLGLFAEIHEAAAAYQSAASRYHGEFARF